MVNFKNNKGITLVMLVVTIIVLLILAGISISAITGGDSSIDKAKKAKDETAIKAEMEELQKIINQSAAKGIRHGNYSGSADSQTIRDALKKNKLIEENPDDVIIDGKNGWKVTGVKTGQKYKIRYDGEVTRIEELAPTKIFAKIEGGVLYLRATEQTGYTEGTQWNDSTITKVIIEEPIAPSNTSYMFMSCTNLLAIENIDNLHTENSINMSNMFRDCSNLKIIDLRYFDTENVTSMYAMFFGCNALIELDLSSFNTNKVTNMSHMFLGCSTLEKLNIKNFDTSIVSNMQNMFYNCKNLIDLDVSNFNTSSVTNMYGMFYQCENLTKINVRNFDTRNVSTMNYMFRFCKNLKELDLSNFDTSNTLSMKSMFQGCISLKKIYSSNLFSTNLVTESEDMFNNTPKLVGGQGTTYNSSYLDKTYARIDGGTSNPGYFTSK